MAGNSNFRSNECIELLKQSDIIVTNPPFSLFREHAAQLIEYDKNSSSSANECIVEYLSVKKGVPENEN